MYYALYRKWRPKVFSDVIDQDYIVKTLKNQVENNKLSHAYLFTGFRGTGKTTCAKILAKAANCLNPHEGNPCNECEICKGIDDGSIMDVLEIDAASNNGVENIRDLREEANFTPSVGRYRVYIIDEVHMLSIGAFNALLKIMEDPPSYVMFILATTEANKVPATILSRCQQFHFNKINKQSIVSRLMFVAKSENINLDEKAAKIIARHANGGLRDALSILDSCVSFAQKREIDEGVVSQVISVADLSDVIEIAKNILNKDIQKTLELIEDITSKYIDPFKLMGQLIDVFKNILLIKMKSEEILTDIDSELIEEIKELSGNVSVDEILKIIDILSSGYDKIARSSAEQLEFELSIMKSIYVDKDKTDINDLDDNKIIKLKEKINKLESEIVGLKNIIDLKNQINYQKIADKNKEELDNNININISDEKIYEEATELDNWSEILEILLKINPGLGAALSDSSGYLNEKAQIVFIKTDNPFFLDLIRSSLQAKQTLKQAIFNVLGKKYRIGPYKINKKDEGPDIISDIEKIAKKNNIKLDIR